MTDTLAEIDGSLAQFKSMLNQSALQGDRSHDDVYLKVLPDRVRILASTPGGVILTYCSFEADWFDGLNVEADGPVEAILNVEDTLTYLGLASDGGSVTLTFHGQKDQQLAERVRFTGDIETGIRLPGSQDALDNVPNYLPDRFTGEQIYTDSSGEVEMPIRIETNVSVVERIIEAVKNDRDAEYYPIAVQDGEFRMNVGDESRGFARGGLHANSVEAPDDVENYYFDGFEEIFDTLSGAALLQTAPAAGAPLAVVQKQQNGKVIRHVNGGIDE